MSVSLQWMRCRVSTLDIVRVSKAIRPLRLQDLCSVSTSVISSTIHWQKQLAISPGSTVRQLRVPMRSGLRIWTLVTIISGGFKEFNSYSRRPKSRQDQAQGISEDYQSSLESLLPKGKSKVFRNPSQSAAEFRKLWRRFCRLSKNHWRRQVIK